jgi:hypothetical protein
MKASESGAIYLLKFSEARDVTGLHEVRALGSHLYEIAGYDIKEELMSHTDEEMTKLYQAGHAEQWTAINLMLPTSIIGRGF